VTKASAVVTGGAGFIGSHLVDRLTAEGHRVLVIDNLVSGDARLPYLDAAGAVLEEVDIREARAAEIIEAFRPSEVYHLAAQADVRRSVADPIYDAGVNILGTLQILQAAAEIGARVVSASSGGCIYGDAEAAALPLDESSPRNPDSPYGISKSVMDDYLHFYGATRGLQFVNLALGNVYGPRQDPLGEAGVVAIFGLRLLKGEPCVIFGDGRQTRDFIYVADVAEAFFLGASRGEGKILNIGSGVETSVNELYGALAEICGSDQEPRYDPPRAGELQRSCLNSALAKNVLGWAPMVDLKDGLRRTVDFLRKQLENQTASN
jgi:UDP-glucose 4-epimerase